MRRYRAGLWIGLLYVAVAADLLAAPRTFEHVLPLPPRCTHLRALRVRSEQGFPMPLAFPLALGGVLPARRSLSVIPRRFADDRDLVRPERDCTGCSTEAAAGAGYGARRPPRWAVCPPMPDAHGCDASATV